MVSLFGVGWISSAARCQAGISEALKGDWLFYSGGAVDASCPKWGVRPGDSVIGDVDDKRQTRCWETSMDNGLFVFFLNVLFSIC